MSRGWGLLYSSLRDSLIDRRFVMMEGNPRGGW